MLKQAILPRQALVTKIKHIRIQWLHDTKAADDPTTNLQLRLTNLSRALKQSLITYKIKNTDLSYTRQYKKKISLLWKQRENHLRPTMAVRKEEVCGR